MLAPQPAGNWYANEWSANSPTVMNRTNIEAVCNAFSPAGGAMNAVLFNEPLANALDLPFRMAGAVSFATTMAFNTPGKPVCNIVWEETLYAEVNDLGELTEIVELYNGDWYQYQMQFCRAPWMPIPPKTSPPSFTDPRRQLALEFLYAVANRDFAMMRKVTSPNVKILDGWPYHPITLDELIAGFTDDFAFGYALPTTFQTVTPNQTLLTVAASTTARFGSKWCTFMQYETIRMTFDASNQHITEITADFDIVRYNEWLASKCA